MSSLLFYKNVVALDREQHRNLRVRPLPNLSFLSDITAVPVVVGEFADIARQGPVGFLRSSEGSGLIPVALMGLPEGRNLYLDADGKWTGSYIPAFIRRYPFLFSEDGERMTVCIDRDFVGFNEVEGEPLFDPSGEPAAFTKNAINLLSEYQRQVAMTQAFTKRLQEADLDELVVTDTLPISAAVQEGVPNLKILSTAPMFGDAILRIHGGRSISEMME